MFYQCTFITTHNIYKCNLPIKIYNTIQIMYFTNINARRPITYQLSQTTKNFHLHILKDILFAIGDGYQIQSPKCTLFHHPRNQDCESSRPECLDLLQRTCTHPYFLTCLKSCFRIQGGTVCCSINFYSINPFDKNAYSALYNT